MREEIDFFPRNAGVGVACRRQAFQPERIETHRKIFEEIALVRVIAVTENPLASEMVAVVLQLVFDKPKVSIELVMWVMSRVKKIAVAGHPSFLFPRSNCRQRSRA